MSDSAFLIAPRRCVIGYGQKDETRAAFVERYLADPERARAETMKMRRQYWRKRVATLERELRRLMQAEQAGRAEWSDSDRAAWLQDVCRLRADLAAAGRRLAELDEC
jgi:hypothetical protein